MKILNGFLLLFLLGFLTTGISQDSNGTKVIRDFIDVVTDTCDYPTVEKYFQFFGSGCELEKHYFLKNFSNLPTLKAILSRFHYYEWEDSIKQFNRCAHEMIVTAEDLFDQIIAENRQIFPSMVMTGIQNYLLPGDNILDIEEDVTSIQVVNTDTRYVITLERKKDKIQIIFLLTQIRNQYYITDIQNAESKSLIIY